jgi:hypothetical protein
MPQIQVRGECSAQSVTEARMAKYVRFWETYIDHKGLERKRLWTAWFDSEQSVGTSELVTIEGELSCKIGTYTAKATGEEKQTVEYVLNNAVFVVREGAFPTPVAAPNYSEDLSTPF